jgi:SRSO17 transposase
MDIVYDLADCLQGFWERFQPCFKTQTRDTSAYGWVYLRGVLLLEGKRNYVNIARRVVGPGEDGQNVQQFMSDSPWSARKVFDQIQAEVCHRPEMSGGMLSLDESGEERAGTRSAGAARQYLGRQGKVDLGQVGVALGYAQAGTWLMVDAELYLPEGWFTEEYADLRRRGHIPKERVFASKVDLGLAMIERAQQNKLPFEVVGCDTVYGSRGAFRAALDRKGIVYMAAVTGEVRVYLQRPAVGVPETPEGKKGRPFSRWQVQNGVASVAVQEAAQTVEWAWRDVPVRLTERGWLTYPCAARRVWTITAEGQVREEWLFLRKEADGSLSDALSHAPADTPV